MSRTAPTHSKMRSVGKFPGALKFAAAPRLAGSKESAFGRCRRDAQIAFRSRLALPTLRQRPAQGMGETAPYRARGKSAAGGFAGVSGGVPASWRIRGQRPRTCGFAVRWPNRIRPPIRQGPGPCRGRLCICPDARTGAIIYRTGAGVGLRGSESACNSCGGVVYYRKNEGAFLHDLLH